MAKTKRLVLSLGCAIALATPFGGAMAQERPNRQAEPRGNDAPPTQNDGRPNDKDEDDKKAKRKEDGPGKAREGRPAQELKKSQDGKPAAKPADASPANAPPATKPEKREPAELNRGRPAPVQAPPADVPPTPAPKKEQPVVAPPAVAPQKVTPPPAPDAAKERPRAQPATPDAKPGRDARPAAPGEKSTAPAPQSPAAAPATAPVAPAAPVPAPAVAPAAPTAPAQQAAPQKPIGTNPPAAVLPAAPVVSANPAAPAAFQPGFQPAGPAPQKLQDIQKGRTERVEDGGKRTVIQEIDNRVIIKQDNRTIIRHDETQRFAKNATNVRSERRSDGTTLTVIVQPGGIQIYNIVDNSGRTVRRYRQDDRGREVNIIDNRSFYRGGAAVGVGLVVGAVALGLRPPEIRIPREKYVVEYERASDEDIYETLTAPPIEKLERRYSLEEVRFSHELRERMRRLDLDTVTFEFGSWDVSTSQFSKLERVAKVMDRVLRDKPDEVFLVEGHTDAVGSDIDNLTLSDRRAQAVAEILTGVFRVPAENLVTQGYGEQYLKVQTQEADPNNRRVAVRRITPLMAETR